MIEQGRHLNELVESAALSDREEKRQLIASASMLLTDRKGRKRKSILDLKL